MWKDRRTICSRYHFPFERGDRKAHITKTAPLRAVFVTLVLELSPVLTAIHNDARSTALLGMRQRHRIPGRVSTRDGKILECAGLCDGRSECPVSVSREHRWSRDTSVGSVRPFGHT